MPTPQGAPAPSAQGLYYVGADYTFASSDVATDTEILTFVIPAGTVINGIVVTFLAKVTGVGSSTTREIFCKAGTDGSEATYATITFDDVGTANLQGDEADVDYDGALKEYKFVVDDLNWAAEQSVSISTQDTGTNGGMTSAQMLNVMGF